MMQPLSSVCEIIMGQAPSGDTYNDNQVGLPLIAGASDFGEVTPKPTRFTTAAAKISRVNDIIVCVRATIGDLNWSDGEYCLGRGVAALRVNERKADRNYIWRAVEHGASRLASLGRGATFKQISKPDIADFEIPLPPLDEQKRIAAILDQADELRRKRQQALTRLNQLGQAIFVEMFGEWNCPTSSKRLGDILEFNNGVNFSSDQKGSQGCLVLDVFNMYTDTIYADTSSLYRVDGLKNVSSRYLEEGDIMFVRSSLKEEGVGWPAIFQEHVEPVAFCGFIIRGRPKSGVQDFHPYFLVHYLRLPAVRRRMINSAGKVAITNINQARLSEIEIPEFHYQEQTHFAEIMKKLEAAIFHEKAALSRSEMLFTALQHRAFTDQLTASALKEVAA